MIHPVTARIFGFGAGTVAGGNGAIQLGRCRLLLGKCCCSDRFAQTTTVGDDRLLHRLAQVVGSDRGALPGLLPVGFPGPPAEPGLPITEHRALHEIMPLASVRVVPPARVQESRCPGSDIG